MTTTLPRIRETPDTAGRAIPLACHQKLEVSEMEMFVLGPVAMAVGAALIYVAVGGPSRAQPLALPQQALDFARQRLAPRRRAPGTVPTFSNADVLLADALTEMLRVRVEIADLRSEVDSLAIEARDAAPRPLRRRRTLAARARS